MWSFGSSSSRAYSGATIHTHGSRRRIRSYANTVLAFIVTTFCLPESIAAEEVYYHYHSYLMKMEDNCLNFYDNVNLTGTYCKTHFNGLCWPPTEAGKTVTMECEDENRIHTVSLTCQEDGSWEKMSLEDYQYECTKYELLNLYVTLPCQLFSLLACIIAFIILAFSRSLWCTRNYIHWHLITSFALKYFVLGTSLFIALVIKHVISVVGQQVVFFISTYLEMCSFSWMFVEGLYLHTVVALTFRFDVDQIKFYWYCAIGWVAPLFFSGIFMIVCVVTQMQAKDLALQLLVVLPITAVLVLNSIFLLNIVRILMSKLRESSGDTQLKHYRRTARATLVLVILLGISYVFPIFVFNLINELLPNMVVIVILISNTILGGLQGFLVSLIYVFLNSEVKAVLLRKWERLFGFNPCPRRRRRNDYYAANTTISRMDDTTNITTLQSPGSVINRSPNLNNNQRHSTGSQTLGNGKLTANSNLENSYEMSVTSGDTSTSPLNGVAREESSPLLAGNVIINENGRTVVHDHEDNAMEHNKKGTDV